MALDLVKEFRSRFGHLFEDVCKLVVRPERAVYTMQELGPVIFRVGEDASDRFHRVDVELENMRGHRLKCSWFQPMEFREPLPCVVYLHGNCGCRLDALEILFVLRHGFTLFAYDASGSGMSDGDFVTLGFYERQDLATVVEFLQGTKRTTALGLWGRSMGAVTAITYASKDESIKCIIADSPFSSLHQLVRDIVKQHGNGWVPGAVVDTVVRKIRKKVAKMAGFDLRDLDTVKYARRCKNVPAFIFHGELDDFVPPKHSQDVAEAYGGSALYRLVKRGGHNTRRGVEIHDIAVPFLRLYLVDKLAGGGKSQLAQALQQHEASLSSVPVTPKDSLDGNEQRPSSAGHADEDNGVSSSAAAIPPEMASALEDAGEEDMSRDSPAVLSEPDVAHPD